MYSEEDLIKARQEGMTQSSKELEIVITEIDALEQLLAEERREKQSLESTVKRYKLELESVLAMDEQTTNHYQTLKVQYTQALIDLSKLETAHQAMQSKHVEQTSCVQQLTLSENQLKLKVQTLSGQVESEREKSEKLMTQWGQQKQQLLRNALEKDRRIAELTESKVRAESDLCAVLDQMKLLKKQCETLEKKNELLDEELCTIMQKKSELESITKAQVATVNRSSDEVRTLKEKNEELQQSLHKFYEENQSLKARLYDKDSEIGKLQSQLKNVDTETAIDQASPRSISNSKDRVIELEKELERVRGNLEAKEKENRELMQICDQLLRKIETPAVDCTRASQ